MGVSILDASRIEFGLAVQAQAETIRFLPPRDDRGNPQRKFQLIREQFSPDGKGDAPVGSIARKLFLEASSQGPKIYEIGDVDQRPIPSDPLLPTFPVSLAKKVPSGEAGIECIVDDSGNPEAIRIVSTTKPEFGYAAAQAVSRWKFKPAIKAGHPVTAKTELAFDFKMRP